MSELGKNAGKAAAGIARLARSAAQGTKRLGRIAQLDLSIADEKKTIKHLYTEIGSLYYEAHRDDPEGFFVQLFQQLDASMEALEAMEAERRTLRDEKKPADAADASADTGSDIEVEIEETPEEPEAEPAPENDGSVEVGIAAEPDETPEA